MRRKVWLYGVAAIAATLPSLAPAKQAPPGDHKPRQICVELVHSIQNDEMNLSMLSSEGIGDDSAPRATMRAAQSTEALEEITTEMAQLKENGCEPYPHRISKSAYLNSAAKCHEAELEQQLALATNKPVDMSPAACDRTTWVRDPF